MKLRRVKPDGSVVEVEYEDFILPNGQYFSELTEEEQDKVINWATDVGIPVLKRLQEYVETLKKEV